MALIPEEDIEFLDEKGFDYELIQVEGAVHLILHHFPFQRYVPQEADMLIRLPAGYPQTAVDMFYTIPDLKLPSGAFPDRCDQHPAFEGKSWQQWSPVYTVLASVTPERRRSRCFGVTPKILVSGRSSKLFPPT
jgi:hypothetical protein